MTVAASKKLALDWGVIVFMAIIHVGAVLAFLPQFFSWQGVGVALLDQRWIGYYPLLAPDAFP
jgi:sn-1 stearoyl-lipid 9-desaturase